MKASKTVEKTTAKAPSAKPSVPRSDQSRASASSKSSSVIALLQRETGATLDEMMEATSWQKHSVRGFLAGALKKRHGLKVTSDKTDRGRVYRVAGTARP